MMRQAVCGRPARGWAQTLSDFNSPRFDRSPAGDRSPNCLTMGTIGYSALRPRERNPTSQWTASITRESSRNRERNPFNTISATKT